MNKDYFGVELEIGDIIAYPSKSLKSGMRLGRVKNLSPKKVTIEVGDSWTTKWYTQIVKAPLEFQLKYRLGGTWGDYEWKV